MPQLDPRALAASFALLLLTACPGRQDAQTLEQVEGTRDPRVVAQHPVACTEVSAVCGRLYEEHAAACLDLVESAAAATRAAMRQCALQDFRAALAHLPPNADRLVATRGLADATRIARDNEDYPANARALDGVAGQLRTMPGGAAYGAYYAADNSLSRVLTRQVPAAQACATLKDAAAGLPAGEAPADLGPRLGTLRDNFAQAMKNRSCA
ncbi:MAG: hypothetical protein RQ966_06200 [Acetobacteraceae bacterium]|nr:hypothetical protein [Acetobacteraceae bacterium]